MLSVRDSFGDSLKFICLRGSVLNESRLTENGSDIFKLAKRFGKDPPAERRARDMASETSPLGSAP
jgi:hypothetical protein